MKANHSPNTAIYKLRNEQCTIVYSPDNELAPDSTDDKLEKIDKILTENYQHKFMDIRLAREGMSVRIPG